MWEEDKTSASVQSLLITPKTGKIQQNHHTGNTVGVSKHQSISLQHIQEVVGSYELRNGGTHYSADAVDTVKYNLGLTDTHS